MEFRAGVDIAATVAGYGLDARRVDTAGEIEAALTSAVETDGPSVVDVLVLD